MKKICFWALIWTVWVNTVTNAQSTAYVLGGGASIGTQRWGNSFDRQPLLAWHGTLAIESVNNDDDRSSLFAQIGYHVKGSAVRVQYLNFNGGGAFRASERFEFNNISLLLGAKQKYPLPGRDAKYYYFGGIRGDYTVSTNLDELLEGNRGNPWAATFYPLPQFVRKIIGGVSVGGGVEFPLSELVGGELRVALHPDLTLQYNQPPIPNIIISDPLFQGQTNTIPERQIRNTTLEITLALRLLRKVVIVD
jgi:hypothetical protein